MNGYRNRGGWLKRQFDRRPRPLWMVVAMDLLLIAVSLVVFALFHHALPRRGTSVGLVSSRDAAAADRSAIAATSDETDVSAPGSDAVSFDLGGMSGGAVSFSDGSDDASDALPQSIETESAETAVLEAETATAEPTAEADASAVTVSAPAMESRNTVGDFSFTFADKFTKGKVVKSDSGYQSANLNISLNRYQSDKVVFYVADIYIRDISCFVTAFAHETYGKGQREWATAISRRIDAVLAVNGDYYGARDDGIVIRNGELYRADPYPVRDVCVLFWDGTLETYSAGAFDAQAAIDSGAYQAWNFGPRLLDDDGRAKTQFNSDVGRTNPRTAIGYYEPGHYCFVVVDGRSDISPGLTLKELSALMEALGCARAYNLDGGNTSTMVAGGQVVNVPSEGGRATCDIVAIIDK